MGPALSAHPLPLDLETLVQALTLAPGSRTRRLLESEGDVAAELSGLIAQLERAHSLVVPRDAALERFVRALNPWAFEPDDASDTPRHPGWLRALLRDGPPDDDGVAFVYRRWRPFAPQRLRDLLRSPLPGVLRLAGFVWVSTRMDRMGHLSQCGASMGLHPGGRWWATRARQDWPRDPDVRARIEARWREPWGDRRQALACFGLRLEREAITRQLDAALLTDDEMACGPLAWRIYDDTAGQPLRALHAHHLHLDQG